MDRVIVMCSIADKVFKLDIHVIICVLSFLIFFCDIVWLLTVLYFLIFFKILFVLIGLGQKRGAYGFGLNFRVRACVHVSATISLTCMDRFHSYLAKR